MDEATFQREMHQLLFDFRYNAGQYGEHAYPETPVNRDTVFEDIMALVDQREDVVDSPPGGHCTSSANCNAVSHYLDCYSY